MAIAGVPRVLLVFPNQLASGPDGFVFEDLVEFHW